ncbi:MAG: hypothetical protein N3A54_06970, partial [Patescibacteria group bacterium]|nr:hypothetical protein [Patescibacteria group bacterium]
ILIDGIEKISKIMKTREGKKLRSIDVLDICNIIGSIVVSGNVRRCVGYGTVVRTKDGYKTIENVKVGDFVLTEDGTYKEVIDHVYQGKQKTIKIITPYNELICTPDHRVAVMKSLSEVEWKEAQDLKQNDRLVAVINHEGKKIDTEFAYILGYFLGNGYADIENSKRRNGGGGMISVAANKTRSQDYVILEKIKNYIERNFEGSCCKISESKNSNSLRLICYRKEVAEFFLQYKQAHTELEIPEFILSADVEGKAAFVAGLMDSDGDNTSKNVIVNSKYPNFLKKLQQMLLDIGIVTKCTIRERVIKEKKHITGYLTLSGIESQKMAHKYIQKYLMRCCIVICERPKNGPSVPDYILLNSGIDKTTINHLTTPSKTGKPRRDVNLHSVFQLEGYKINKNWIPIPIVSVVEHEVVDTYDISVRENSNFMANNMLIHNTAQIALGDPDDYLYLRAKRWDLGNIPNWRAMSNNTIYIDDFTYIQDSVWEGYVGNGEPYGFFNLPLSQKYGRLGEEISDSCEGLNPCGEITLSNYECCNLSELYLPNISSKEEMLDLAKLLYKTQKAIAAMKYIHKETEEIVHKNMRLG